MFNEAAPSAIATDAVDGGPDHEGVGTHARTVEGALFGVARRGHCIAAGGRGTGLGGATPSWRELGAAGERCRGVAHHEQ